MGAWGAGSFENDTAMDWTYGVESVADVSKVFERLKAETDVHPDGGQMHLDADFACELVAAAECVAMMMGRIIPGFPEEVKEALADTGEPDALLFHHARNALMQVTRHSELAELWEEAAEDGETNEWLAEVTGLVERLNPDLEYEAPVLPEVSDEDRDDEQSLCAFCRQPIPDKEFFGMSVTEYGDIFESSRILPIHLKCLNARLHHSTAVIAFREDLSRPVDLDKL
jgi:hypothetical protein